MILYNYIKPSLLDGEYRMHVETDVTLNGAPQVLESQDAFFNVEGPRFSLSPSEVAGVFPPRNGHGAFDSALPHIVLGRRTLPWERVLGQAFTASADGTPFPWLALVVFEEGEYQITHQSGAGRCGAAGCVQPAGPSAKYSLRCRGGQWGVAPRHSSHARRIAASHSRSPGECAGPRTCRREIPTVSSPW